jgi:hypothetical protein
MNQIKTCKYCDTTFEDIHPNVFANHVRWCTKNTSNGDKGSSKIQSALEKAFNKKLGEFREFEVLCKKCERNFLVKEREKLHPTREVYYCSKRCSKSRIISDEMKENIKKKLLKTEIRSCIFCKKQFSITKKSKQKLCSKGCANKNRSEKLDKESYKYYKSKTNFQFNLADFPDEFDFSLVEKFGWYSAKNRGNNLKGISRDHIISVMFGYKNGIDPKIIAHPANCRLLTQSQNASKNDKCDMLLEDLLKKIEAWNEKYNHPHICR